MPGLCSTGTTCRYLKHPTFMAHNLIALATPHLIGINCGVVYSHNAHPAGPTAWAAYQVPDRTLRWLENQPYILELLNATTRPHKLQDIGFEQSVYNDAVWSIVSGKPFFGHSLRPDYNPSMMGAWQAFHKSIGPETFQTQQVCMHMHGTSWRCCPLIVPALRAGPLKI
jgi:hypothetical protein